MRTAKNTNNYTVEGLVAKYRNFVKENFPQEYVPSEWQDEKGNWHNDDFYAIIDPEAEEQLLVSLYKDVLGDQADAKVLQSLAKRLEVFKREAFTEDEYIFLCKNFSAVSEYLFDHWNEWLGGHPVLSTASSKIKDYVRKTSLYKEGQSVFIADTSYCDVAAIFTGCFVNGFTGFCGSSIMYDHAWALGQIRLIAAGIQSTIVPGTRDESGNYSYPLPSNGSVDIAIYGTMRRTKCTDIESIYNLLKDGGQMLIFISRFEFSSIKEKDRVFFHNLVEEKAISSIVSFEDEDSILGGTDIEILLCVEKKKHSTVYVESAIRGVSLKVDAKSLDAEMLWPGFYLANRPKQGCLLSSLTRLFNVMDEYDRQYNLRKKKGSSDVDDRYEGLYRNLLVLSPKDFGKRYCDANLEAKALSPVSNSMFDDYRFKMLELDKSGVCLFGNSENLLVGYINDNPTKYVCITSVPYLIPKRGIDVRYIAALLLSPEVRQQIISICDGNVNTSILSMVLDRIIVPKHNPKERLQFLAEANYMAMICIQQELKKNHEDYKKAVRMRKHALTQSLSSIQDMFDVLNYYREQQDGNLSDDEMICTDPDISVRNAFIFLSENIKEMMPVIEHIADVEYSFETPRWIDPEEFVEEYIAKNENGWRGFIPIITWQKGHNRTAADIIDHSSGRIVAKKGSVICRLVFPEDALSLIFNNIISNARAHAFTDETRKDYKLRFSWHTDGFNLQIVIENNGTPIPADYDTASLLEYGVSSKLHKDGHNGIGCNEINDIMQRYDGKVEIISTPENEFTVKYVLTFKSNVSLLHIDQIIQIQHK